ncbi:hypothetical protein WDW86_17800 [Bdellovibrionota bacterium FG-2]
MKYANGKDMPKNVIRALMIAGKVGFLSRALWNEFCATGNERWNQKQLQLLGSRGLLMAHPNPAAREYWVLTPLARRLLENSNCVSIRPAPVAQIHHDECITRWLLWLGREKIVTSWRGEMELKSAQVKEFQLGRDARNQKYPDAVFKIRALGSDRTFALEYERTGKSALRYKDILWLYSRMDSMNLVIFVCENLALEAMILGRLKHLRQPVLWNRVALTQSKDWQKGPTDAPIRLDGNTFTIRELAQQQMPPKANDLAATIAA